MARWLGPTQQGVLSVLLVYPFLSQQLIDLGLRQAAARAIGQNERPAGVVVATVFLLWCVTGLLGFTIVWRLLAATSPRGSVAIDHVLAALLLPMLCAQSYAGGILIGSNRVISFASTRWIPSFAQLILLLLAWKYAPSNVTWALGIRGGALVFSAIILFLLVIAAVPRPWPPPEWKFAKDLVARGITYGLAMALALFQYRVGILTLEWWSNSTEIGYFSIAQQTAEVLWQIPQAFGVIVFADSVASRERILTTRQSMRSLRQTVWLGAAAALVGIVAGPWVFPRVYGLSFAPMIPCFIALTPGIVAIMAFKIGRFDLVGQGRPWMGTQFVFLGLGANLFISRWLVPSLGALGAAVGTSIGYATAGIGFYWSYRREHLAAVDK